MLSLPWSILLLIRSVGGSSAGVGERESPVLSVFALSFFPAVHSAGDSAHFKHSLCPGGQLSRRMVNAFTCAVLDLAVVSISHPPPFTPPPPPSPSIQTFLALRLTFFLYSVYSSVLRKFGRLFIYDFSFAPRAVCNMTVISILTKLD